MRARKRVLGRDVVAVCRQAAEIGCALGDQVEPPVGEVGRKSHPDLGHRPPRLAHQQPHVIERDRGCPVWELRNGRCRRRLAAPPLLGCRVRDLGDLAAVVAGGGDEVLQDDLLDVAVAAVDGGERFERRDPLLGGLPDPDQDPAANGSELPGRLDRLQARAGAWRASRRGPCPSAARRWTRASAPARRSPPEGASDPHDRARRDRRAAADRAPAPARTPRRRRRRIRRARRRRGGAATSAFTSGASPVSTRSSLAFRRSASSRRCSTSSREYRCGRWVAKAQYLQWQRHVRDSDRVYRARR